MPQPVVRDDADNDAARRRRQRTHSTQFINRESKYMAKDQNTMEKRRREMEKKRKADEKRERRRRKKEQAAAQNAPDSGPESDA